MADNALLHIGASPATIAEVRQAINDILASGAEQKTLRAALQVLGNAAKVTNTTITDCSFTGPVVSEAHNVQRNRKAHRA